jgi:hypothetical protein
MSEKHSFAIIKHRGSNFEATTLDGHKVKRQEKIWIPDYNNYINCAPYDDHFIFEDPEKNKIGRWMHMCTCGSPAVVVGYNVYKADASNSGALMVCWLHASTGLHGTGGSKWV